MKLSYVSANNTMLKFFLFSRFVNAVILYSLLCIFCACFFYFPSKKNGPELVTSGGGKVKVVSIDFVFELNSYKANQNIFQTSSADAGIRLEVSNVGFPELIFRDEFYGIKHCAFVDKLALNTRYKFHMEYHHLPKELISSIDSNRLCYAHELGLTPKFDRIIFGNGGWFDRGLDGSVFEPRILFY